MVRLPCEFFLVRYVPDVVKGEFVNIGVLLREAGGDLGGGAPERRPGAWAQVRFTRDWSRVRCLDADADLALLEGLEQEIAGRLEAGAGARDPKPIVALLEDTLSNSVQISEARASEAENMTVELEQLMRLYVEPLKTPARAKTGRAAGRTGIVAGMRTEFERAGVWGLMRKRIAAASYTGAGDPLKLDCGYRAGPERTGRPDADALVRIFQGVSLAGEIEAAKVLAYSAPQLRAGVRRVEAAELELTAVVEPLRSVAEQSGEGESGEAEERYRFGVETLERQAIRVITWNDLARAAETAKYELGL